MAFAARIREAEARGDFVGEFNAGEQVAEHYRYVFNIRLDYFGGDQGYFYFIIVSCIFAPFASRRTLLRRFERNALIWYHGLLIYYLGALSVGHELFLMRLPQAAGYDPGPVNLLTRHGVELHLPFELLGTGVIDLTSYDPSRICIAFAVAFLALLLVRGRPVV